MASETPIRAWHFISESRRLGYDDGREVVEGETLSCEGEVTLCKNGMHASRDPFDALQYAPGPILCLVEVSGDVYEGSDKLVGRNRKCVRMVDMTRTLHEFALWNAERALAKIKNPDPRSVDALRVKRAWLDGLATDEELSAADSAAWSAADSAAWSAAWSVARSAAWSAARSAAWSAARTEFGRLVEELFQEHTR